MIKAKKGLLITLFAAMMVFAFGATSAFADTTNAKPDWNGDYTKVTISGCTEDDAVYNRTYDTNKAFNSDSGAVDVTIKTPDIDGLDASKLATWSTSYYDLDNAVFSKGDVEVKGTYTSLTGWGTGVDGILLKAPTGTYTGTAPIPVLKAASANEVKLEASTNWTGTISYDPATISASSENQTVTVSLAVSYTQDSEVNTIGKIADKVVTIEGTPAQPSSALFFLDEVDKTKTSDALTTTYDGAEHTVVMTDLPGYTVSYTVFNSATGKWDAVSAVTVKDAGSVSFKATIKDAAGKDVTPSAWTARTATVSPQAVGNLKFGFPTTTDSGKAIYTTSEATYDAYSYVEAQPALAKQNDKVVIAAIDANQAELQAAFKEAYDIDGKVSKDDANQVTLTIKAKSLKTTETDALVKKYETLFGNFGITTTNVGDLIVGRGNPELVSTATVNLNAAGPEIAPEIEFTKSPTTVSYKVKALKKKAKTFTVKAESTDGTAVNYKLINAPKQITINKTTGKIKVAKKTKKGTYKIKVKAYKVAPWNGQIISETHAITIKVKK